MRKIALFFVFLFGTVCTAFAQRIPLEVSFGVGGYFPEDGRYSHFFDHNPAGFSGQAVYGWKILDFKVGFERLQKRTNSATTSSDSRFFSEDEVTVDSVAFIDNFSTMNSYMRATTFRFGTAFHPFRWGAFSPFLGFGGSVSSSKGHGNVEIVTDSTIVYVDTTTDRSVSDTAHSSVSQFSESVFGTYLEAGVKTQLPKNFFFVFEAIRDFRSKNKAGVIGPVKGGGTLIGMRLGYRF